MKLRTAEVKEFLDLKADQYNNRGFITDDPVSIPHRYSLKEDIEISGFLVATIAWGNRKSIVKNGHRMMDLMDNAPYDFVLGHAATDLKRFEKFVHRTFNAADLAYFVKALRHIYRKKGGIETLFNQHATEGSLQPAIHHFRKAFFELPFEKRTAKHVSDPMGGSAAKRINMYLRWMVRKDKRGVDFGIWKSIQASQLSCPLDIHSGKVARKLGLLSRAQNDARAVEELDRNLRRLDPADPVKYDFALFGLGVFEHF